MIQNVQTDNLHQFLNNANKTELKELIEYYFCRASKDELEALHCLSKLYKEKYYKNHIFFRGLLEFTSFCKNNCYYCGLQRDNKKAVRYRLSKDEILDCCNHAYNLGFKTFVLQGGEDLSYSDSDICKIVYEIKNLYPSCAVTLSIGEKSKESYKKYYVSGADRYLLRHETANNNHYSKLHPDSLTLKNRKRCLWDLKEIGYQVGAGFMVDSPFQSLNTLADDLKFLRDLSPHMIGIGPFIPHCDTIFSNYCNPKSNHTLILLSLIRIMLPKTLIPATTALGTIDLNSQIHSLLNSANVIMPNISPNCYRNDYSIYDSKLHTGFESADNIDKLSSKLLNLNLKPDFSRGDHIDFKMEEQ